MDLLDKIDSVLDCLYHESEHHPTLAWLQEKLKGKDISQHYFRGQIFL
jgi:hypothetical protein